MTNCKTQAELDAAIKAKCEDIRLVGAVWFDVRGSTVTACDSSTVRAYGSSTVRAYGSSTVTACDSSTVTVCDSSTVRAYDSSTVTACGSSTVTAYDSSTVTACGSSTVTAYDSSTVTAYDSSTVRAYGSSTVTACGSSTVTAYDSSTVTACDSSTVRAYGSSTVTAGNYVSITVHGKNAKVKGKYVIRIPELSTPAQWCDFYGLPVTRGSVIVFKAVNDDFKSPHGADYTPGKEVKPHAWNAKVECDNGLHFSPRPFMALRFHAEANRFVACRVKLSEMAVHPDGSYPDKCKAQRCKALYECDMDGKKLESKDQRAELAKGGSK